MNESFGVGKIIGYNSYIDATDYIISNSEITEENSFSIQWIKGYPTIQEFLDKYYKKKKMEFSIKSQYGTLYDHAYLNENNLVAVVTIVENSPQIFISQCLKEELKRDNRSIIRCHSVQWLYSLNTKTSPISFFKMPSCSVNPFEHPNEEIMGFYQDYQEWQKSFICDFIVKRDAIALFFTSYSLEIIGTFDKSKTIDEYFKKKFEVKPLPFQERDICNGFWSGGNILASYKDTEKGEMFFITREGCYLLAENDLAVIRAKKCTDKDKIWEKLDLIFVPRGKK